MTKSPLRPFTNPRLSHKIGPNPNMFPQTVWSNGPSATPGLFIPSITTPGPMPLQILLADGRRRSERGQPWPRKSDPASTDPKKENMWLQVIPNFREQSQGFPIFGNRLSGPDFRGPSLEAPLTSAGPRRWRPSRSSSGAASGSSALRSAGATCARRRRRRPQAEVGSWVRVWSPWRGRQRRALSFLVCCVFKCGCSSFLRGWLLLKEARRTATNVGGRLKNARTQI